MPKLHNSVLLFSPKKKKKISSIQTKILICGCHSMSQCLFSAVYSLKLLGSLGKTETSLRSLNLSLFYHKFLSYDKKRFNVFIALKDLLTIIMVTAQYHRHLKGCLSRN